MSAADRPTTTVCERSRGWHYDREVDPDWFHSDPTMEAPADHVTILDVAIRAPSRAETEAVRLAHEIAALSAQLRAVADRQPVGFGFWCAVLFMATSSLSTCLGLELGRRLWQP